MGAVGLAKIEIDVFGGRLVAGGHHGEPLERVGFVAGAKFVEPFRGVGELGKEGGGDLGANFVATAADRRAKRGEQIGRIGSEFHLHFSDGLADNALERATPARMDGGDSTFSGIDEKNGNAIGGLDAQEETRLVRHRSVAAAGIGGNGFENVHDMGVKLFERDESELRCTESRLQTAAIFQYVFAGVPFREAEIEDLLDSSMRDRRAVDQRADTAGARAETVD